MSKEKYKTLSSGEIANLRKVINELERYRDKKTGDFVIKSEDVQKFRISAKMGFTLKYLLIHIKDIDIDNEEI